jgi:hypothetical protein
MIYVVDSEANSLTPDRFYCICYSEPTSDVIHSATTYKEMREIVSSPDNTLIMHNGIMWDKPNLSRVLGVEFKAKIIDTLFLSWYLFPTREVHGIESWGVEFGVPKPVITDWEGLPLETYVHRCSEDIKIGKKLWLKMQKYLAKLYEVKQEDVYQLPIVSYLSFKAETASRAKQNKWKLDRRLCEDSLSTLYAAREEKVIGLKAAMPKVPIYSKRNPPAKFYKKDGSYSTKGSQWLLLLNQLNLPDTHRDEIKLQVGEEPPNPASHPQIKDWLFSLGWDPATFKYEREADGSLRRIPQVRNKDKLLCPSVLLLAEKEPAINLLDGLSVINHRISILEGFLKAIDDDDYVHADVQGLTNTLRFKHKVIVNLPGVDKPWGKEIRGALKASNQGHEVCGADMSSLEDMTKRHYIYPYDPEYVKEMDDPDFDPHLDLAMQRGVVTKQQVVAHVRGEKDLSKIRKPYKVVNYSATYGVGAPKLSREMGIKEYEAKELLDVFWKRNWAIKKFAEDCTVKKVGDQMWVLNPVSKFWLSLRNTRDVFSTVNQSTGVYCFDTWLYHVSLKLPNILGQFHDEAIWEILRGDREETTKILQWAIDKTNEKLNLNIKLDISIKYGDNYAEIH